MEFKILVKENQACLDREDIYLSKWNNKLTI